MRFECELDEQDEQAVNRAIAYRQTLRINGECILPDSDGDRRGTILAEICRDWMEYKQRVRASLKMCPRCRSQAETFSADLDWCPKCHWTWPGT